MDIQKVSEDARCRIFPATLSDAAQEWYVKFSASSIDSWEQFVQDFYKQFYVGRIHPMEANQLVDIRQKEDESLKAYIQRFMQAASRAKTVGDEGKMMAITAEVKHKTGLWKSLRKNGVRTMQEFLDRADQYIKLEKAKGNLGKSSPDSKKNGSKKEKDSNKNGAGSNKEKKNKRPEESTNNDSKRPKYLKYEPRFTNDTVIPSVTITETRVINTLDSCLSV